MKGVKKVVIDENVVVDESEPILLYENLEQQRAAPDQ